MPLPNEFLPGEVARSSEVNEIFAYIMSLLGQLTTPDRIRTTTEFQMGARQNVLMTGTHDSGAASRKFFQIGWNADWNLVNGSWKFVRFINGEPATAIRLGDTGFSVYTTQDTSGDLQGPLSTPAFAVRRTATSKHVYIPDDTNITRVDSGTMTLGEFRLTYVPFLSPKTLREGAWGSGSETKDAKNFGVPTSAKAISISCEVTAGSSNARIRFMQRRSSPSFKYGFSVSAPANSIGSGSGIVILGTDSYAIDFTIERTASFNNVNAYITGYWV
jgi:hypothetical protein